MRSLRVRPRVPRSFPWSRASTWTTGCSALVAALLVVAVGEAHGARTIRADPDKAWGITHLGDWRVAADPSYAAAVRRLGDPSHVENPDVPSCQAHWPALGLSIQFENFGVGRSCEIDGRAQSATVQGSRGRREWHTEEGLRVGDRVPRLRRLYPDALRRGGAWWVVYQESSPIGAGGPHDIVSARTRRGRVQALDLWIGGAGE
jgi:hypothetical protein